MQEKPAPFLFQEVEEEQRGGEEWVRKRPEAGEVSVRHGITSETDASASISPLGVCEEPSWQTSTIDVRLSPGFTLPNCPWFHYGRDRNLCHLGVWLVSLRGEGGHHSGTMSCDHDGKKVTQHLAKSMVLGRGKLGAPAGNSQEFISHGLQHRGPTGLQQPNSPPQGNRGHQGPEAPSDSSLLYGQLCFRCHLAKLKPGDRWKTEKSKTQHIHRDDYQISIWLFIFVDWNVTFSHWPLWELIKETRSLSIKQVTFSLPVQAVMWVNIFGALHKLKGSDLKVDLKEKSLFDSKLKNDYAIKTI